MRLYHIKDKTLEHWTAQNVVHFNLQLDINCVKLAVYGINVAKKDIYSITLGEKKTSIMAIK